SAPRRHRPRRRGLPVSAHRPRPDRGRIRPGRRMADPGGSALGRLRQAQPGTPGHAGGEHLQDPSFSEAPEVFNISLLDKAHEEGAVYGSKAVGEPPLMLAFSVREALREAVAAFGAPGSSVRLASPAT